MVSGRGPLFNCLPGKFFGKVCGPFQRCVQVKQFHAVVDGSVRVTMALSRLVYLGKLPVSVPAGTGYWMDTSESGPEATGL